MDFCADKVVEVVEGSTVFGFVDDEIAFGKPGIEFCVEQSPNSRRGGRGFQITASV